MPELRWRFETGREERCWELLLAGGGSAESERPMGNIFSFCSGEEGWQSDCACGWAGEDGENAFIYA